MPKEKRSLSIGDDDGDSGGFPFSKIKDKNRERKLRNLRKQIAQLEKKVFDVNSKRDKISQQLIDCNKQITELSEKISNERSIIQESERNNGSRPLPTVGPGAYASIQAAHSMGSSPGNSSFLAPRRFLIGGTSTSYAVILALPQNILRLIAVCCDPRTRGALACTCRKLHWVVSDPSVAKGDLSVPVKPFPEGAPWAAPPLFCIHPQNAPTHNFLASRGGTAAAATALAQSKIRSQMQAPSPPKAHEPSPQDEPHEDPTNKPANRRLQRTHSRHQDMGLMLALNLKPAPGSSSMTRSPSSGNMKRSSSRSSTELIVNDAPVMGRSANSSPLLTDLSAPIDTSLSDTETGEEMEGRHRRLMTERSELCDIIDDHDFVQPSPKDSSKASDSLMHDITGSVSILPTNAEPCSECLKICLIGESSVGKSSLLDSVESVPFVCGAQKPTKGYSVRAFPCLADSVTRFDVIAYDIGGNERRQTLLTPFFVDCDAVVFCYAVNSKDSLLKMVEWISLVRYNIPPGRKDPLLFLLGCKSDVPSDVQLEEVSMLTIKTGASFVGECSCSNPESIEDSFTKIAQSVYLNKQFKRFKDEVLK